MTQNELAHYGILGMKWGVRRTETQLARARGKKAPDEDASDDYKKAHSKKSVKSMSDKELRDRLNRLNMEQQYNKLTSEKSTGRKLVEQVVGNAAKELAKNYASKYMAKAAEAGIKAAIELAKKKK